MRSRTVLLMLMMALVSACGGSGGDNTAATATSGPSQAGAQESTATEVTGDVPGRLLVWMGEGAAPNTSDRVANSTGQLVTMNLDGTTETLLEIPGDAISVQLCGSAPVSPDGRFTLLYVNQPQAGADSGTLYQMTDGAVPVEIGVTEAITCAGNGTIRYSPDSSTLSYIQYRTLGQGDAYSVGTLRILDTATLNQVASAEDVVAFSTSAGQTAYISFFPNDRGIVDESAIGIWDGSELREVASLYPEAGCRLNSASISAAADNTLVVMAGQRCGNDPTQRQIHRVNPEDGTTEMVFSTPQQAGFLPYARTNFVLPANDQLLLTIPDGITANTVGIARFTPADAAQTPVIERGAVMPRYEARTFTLPDDAAPRLSQDGRWWMMVVSDGSTPPSVVVIDLNNPTAAPIIAANNIRGDRIPFMAFAPDGAYYLVGGTGGGENALFRLNFASAAQTEVASGQFGPGAVSPDGSQLALLAWLRAEDRNSTPYTNLVILDAATAETQTLFTGIELNEDGSVAARRFAYPLLWLGR